MRKGLYYTIASIALLTAVPAANAATFSLDYLNSLGGPVLPEPDDPGGYPAATLIGEGTPGEYTWDLGKAYRNALIALSTDHLEQDEFSFDVWSSDDLAHWTEAALATVYHSTDSDDFASIWKLGEANRYVRVNSNGGMVLSQADAVPGAFISSTAEFDGVSAVPEPATATLLVTAAAFGLGIYRKKEL